MSGEYLRPDLHLDPPFRNTAYAADVSSLNVSIACQGHPAHPPSGRLWKRRFILPMRTGRIRLVDLPALRPARWAAQRAAAAAAAAVPG
jgi:hypothetical protein